MQVSNPSFEAVYLPTHLLMITVYHLDLPGLWLCLVAISVYSRYVKKVSFFISPQIWAVLVRQRDPEMLAAPLP